MQFYLVNGIEENRAVLVADSGGEFSITLDQLPAGLAEGLVLLVPLDITGKPNWSLARIDEPRTARCNREAAELLDAFLISWPKPRTRLFGKTPS